MTTASVRDSNIIAALADGKTTRWVADTFGLTTFKVVQVAGKHGVIIDGDGHAKDTDALHAAATAINGHTPPPLPDSADPAALLNRALTHPAARIRAKAERARDLLAEIAQALHAEAERDLARTRIAKLEKQLAAEKARLRGANPAVRPRRQPGGTLPCPDCDSLFTSPQGVSLHRVQKHGYRAGGAA